MLDLPIGLNPWSTLPIVVASVDYVKRPEVLPAVLSCRWDVIVIDEAHDVGQGSEEGGNEPLRSQAADTVVAVDGEERAGRDGLGQAELTAGRHQMVGGGHDDRHRRLDDAEPRVGSIADERPGGLEDGGQGVASDHVERRPAPTRPGPAADAAGEGAHRSQGWARHPAGRAGEGRQRGERKLLQRRHGKMGSGGAQHHPGHQLGVPTPQERRHWSTHRVADRDDRARAEDLDEGGGVVGTRLERERAPDAATVAPVEVGRRRPAVEQEGGRRALGALELAYPALAPTGELDVPYH